MDTVMPADGPEPGSSPATKPSLSRPLGTLDLWGLGVGTVMGGQYFGWNLALPGNGPVALLLASLIVSLLFLAWTLSLAELAVAMPFAGGPLAFGRRAVGPWLGFVMAWSMVLGCLFAAAATALACGSYVAFLANPTRTDPTLTLWAGLATLTILFLLHVWGVREQSWAMLLMTAAALAGLMLFWGSAGTLFSWERIWPSHDLLGDKGWKSVVDALPYALWWLIVIEGVALAAEETRQPQRSIPRGLMLATLTITAMTVLTTVLACGAVEWRQLDEDYPLGKVVHYALAERSPFLVRVFGFVALVGLVASCHGLLYGASRQAFALGRAGYLPLFLGRVHHRFGTPAAALSVCSALTGAFLTASFWLREALDVAILVAGLASVVGYVLAIFCLLRLRRLESELFRRYRAPFPRLLPLTVVLLSGAVMVGFSGLAAAPLVFALTALLYTVGFGYFWLWARKRVESSAPEEQTAGLPPAVIEEHEG